MAIRKGTPQQSARWFNDDGTPTQEAYNFLARGPFMSQPQEIADGTVLTLTHGLGVTPSRVTVTVRNNTAAAILGIGANREVSIPLYEDANDHGVSVSFNATDINVTVGANGIRLMREDAPIGAMAAITNANWRLIVRADA